MSLFFDANSSSMKARSHSSTRKAACRPGARHREPAQRDRRVQLPRLLQRTPFGPGKDTFDEPTRASLLVYITRASILVTRALLYNNTQEVSPRKIDLCHTADEKATHCPYGSHHEQPTMANVPSMANVSCSKACNMLEHVGLPILLQ